MFSKYSTIHSLIILLCEDYSQAHPIDTSTNKEYPSYVSLAENLGAVNSQSRQFYANYYHWFYVYS